MFKSFLNQSYEHFFEKCSIENILFEDSYFPASNTSLGVVDSSLVWKRPLEICQNPKFIVNKIEVNDLDLGGRKEREFHGWLIASLGTVASVPEYIDRVIPSDQSFENNYCGLFRFRFWRLGEWIEVIIDDRIPVNTDGSFYFCHNKVDRNEFFAPLFEKAFAKLHKSYSNLHLVSSIDALIDLTGGVHERFSFKREKYQNELQFWNLIFKSFTMKSLIGACINGNHETGRSIVLSNGLNLCHAYSVLGVYELINVNGQFKLKATVDNVENGDSVKLLNIRNLWGQANRFTGEWNPSSALWTQFSQEIKDQLNLESDKSDFFMTFDEFLREFDQLDIVHVNLATNSNSAIKWIEKQMHGSWKKGETSGGCGSDFWMNPQFYFSLKFERNEKNEKNDRVSVIVSLLQTGILNNINPNLKLACFCIFRVNDGVEIKKKYNFADVKEVARVLNSSGNSRQKAEKVYLVPGNYIIIPSLFNKDDEGNFLIRLFIESQENISVKTVNLNAQKKEDEKISVENVNKNNQQENVEHDEDYYDGYEDYYDDEYDEEYYQECVESEYTKRDLQIPQEFIDNLKYEKFDYNRNANSRACLIM